jgi:hypothetical protein
MSQTKSARVYYRLIMHGTICLAMLFTFDFRQSKAETTVLRTAAPNSTQGSFKLSHPTNGATDQPLELKLTWTEAAGATKYVVELAEEVTFAKLLVNETVQPSTSAGQGEFDIKKKHKLRPGTTYFWRVTAVFADGSTKLAESQFKFKTMGDFFGGLKRNGFKLQKALTGPDKGEMADFSFLHTVGESTVYSATFAFSWQSNTINQKPVAIQTSVEGALASDDSESEDAWRIRASAVFTPSFVRCKTASIPCPVAQFSDPLISSLYVKASFKYEGDRDFTIKKVSGEFLVTPNSFRLAMGTARPISPAKPIQFQWRPFFQIDVGQTYRPGASAERNDTILRLIPRARAVLNLQFLRRALNMDDVNIFVDDTFYHLPLESGKKNYNFLLSGMEFSFNSHLGVTLTYKNGSSAPKFQKINTLEGGIGIRF